MLDSDGCANTLNNGYEDYKKNQSMDYLDFLNKTLDTYCQLADRSMNNIVILTSAGSMNIERKDRYEMTLEIATKFMSYWALCIATRGVPETLPMGGVITTVSNDAMSYVMPLKNDLDNLIKSVPPGDNYKQFCKLLFDYAKKVVWTVVETYPDKSTGAPIVMTYTVSVS